MRRTRLLSALGATVVVAAAAVTILAVSQSAQAAAGAPLPAHVFAPYFEAYQGDSLSGLASQSGNKYLTMAFLQTATRGSCTAYWNGDSSMPIAASTFGGDISTIQAGGGNVVPSFGGYAADNGGTEIADSCTTVASIAAVYESVITTYNVTRIDLDTEDNSLTNSAGIDRRNKAIKMVEDWAAANGRTVQFVYTLPTTTSGLASSGLAVLQNAVANNARVDIVNIMTFDYYDNASHEMATDTQRAANGLHSQLASLYPGKTSSDLWSMIGVTEMIGIDDFGAPETFTLADGPTVLNWATSQGIAELSFWALQRDNGSCPGGSASDTCSGLSQTTWQFSHVFEPFSGGTVSPSPTSTGTTSPSPSPTRTTSPSPPPSPTGGTCTFPVWNAATAYVGGTSVTYNGHTYTSKWWTQGEQPDTHSGQYDVWIDKGACSGGTTSPSPTRTTSPTPSPTRTASPTPSPTATGAYPAWVPNHAYTAGDRVSYAGHNYQCLQSHTSLVGWEPPNVPALWQFLN